MSRATIARSRRCAIAVLIGLLGVPAAAAQDRAGSIAQKLERAGVIDNYFPDAAQYVANTLVQAAPGRWQGVQVNQAPRDGWLHIYLIDARRLPDDNILADEGVDNFTGPELAAGGTSDEDSASIFLNTAMWKRLAAATVMKESGLQSDLMSALAIVDSVGLERVHKFWEPATLSEKSPDIRTARWLLRGALAFVLAHEMGHLMIGHAKPSDEASQRRLSQMTKRQADESRACPELLPSESRQRQKHEHDADMAAVTLLGRQCQIGNDGKQRHAIYMIGTSWYFLASMSDKLFVMGRNTDSPNIANALRARMGDQLYQLAIAAHAAEKRRGAVKFAYPASHPPDTERMQAIEAAMRATPCGGDGLSSSGAQLLEMFRLQMCQQMIGQGQAR